MTLIFQFIIAYSCCVWYFTPCNPDFSKPGVDPSPVWKGLFYALRYHLGSLALAAGLVAIFRLVQTILEFIAKQASASNNKVALMIAESCMCCVWCFEQVVRYINKNAIIELTLKSTDYFSSAGSAMKVLTGGAPEVVTLNGMTYIFQILGTASIAGASGFIGLKITTNTAMFTDSDSDHFVEEPMVIAVAAGVVGFIVAAAFMLIFDMVSDTLLYCWLTDTKDGVTEFAPAPLRDLIGSSSGAKGDSTF